MVSLISVTFLKIIIKVVFGSNAMLFYFKFFKFMNEIKFKHLGLQPIHMKNIHIDSNDRTISHLTEIMLKKEIFIPYLLHIRAAEEIRYEGLYVGLCGNMIKLWLTRGR